MRTRARGCGRYEMFSYPPHATPLAVEAELNVLETVDRCLSRNSASDRANVTLRRDGLVAGTLRNEVGMLQVKCPELVCHDRLTHILEWLREQTNGQLRGVVNVRRDTYVYVGNPAQGANHRRFRDVVTGVQGQS